MKSTGNFQQERFLLTPQKVKKLTDTVLSVVKIPLKVGLKKVNKWTAN